MSTAGSNRHLLTADEILAATDMPREEVEVPEWGGLVIVRGLTGAERDAFEAGMVVIERKGARSVSLANFRAKLVGRCIIDENGRRLFTDAQVEALGNKSALAMERVFVVARRLSGLNDEDVEELTKN